jgi:sn-glycerol 3-phosphate transport system substrate-binding protein
MPQLNRLALILASLTLSVSAQAATDITLWHAMGGALGETVNQIVSDFNASQTDVKVTPVFKGGYEETLTAGIAAYRAGAQPHMIQVFDAGAATMIGAKGATVSVQDLLNQNGYKFNINDYISGVRYFYADTNGKMIGMPFNSSSPIMYYNKAALAKAGVEPPKTWEEFEAIAPKLKAAGYIPLTQSHTPWIFVENFMSRHNLQFATNNNGYAGAKGTKILVNNAPIRMHFNKLVSWKKAGLFEYYGSSWDDNQAPFENQKVAIWLGSSGSFGGLMKSAKFDFAAAPLPYWKSVIAEGKQTFIGGASLFAMSGKSAAENKATAAFFNYLTSPKVQLAWHQKTGYVPVTNAAYELAKKDGYYQQKPAAEVGVKQLNLPSGEWTKGYRMGFYVQIRDVMNREFGKVFAGETSVEDAFGRIETEGNELLGRFERTMAN